MITDLTAKIVSKFSKQNTTYIRSQKLRAKSLIQQKELGDLLIEARDYLSKATKYEPIEGYTGHLQYFMDIAKELEISKSTLYNYIELAELWPLAEKINLLSQKNSFRLIASLKILRWAKAKFEENPDAIVDAADYFKEVSNSKSSNSNGLALQVAVLSKEISYYKSQCEEYKDLLADAKQQIEELKRQLDLQGMY